MNTPTESKQPHMHVAGVRAVLLGGFCAIGISCFSGSLFAGTWLRVAVSRGANLQDAYAALMASSGTSLYWLALVPQAVAGAVGGYIAARGGKNALVYAGLSGLVYLLFTVSMYINPASQVAPLGYLLISLVVPFVSALVGGILYANKT